MRYEQKAELQDSNKARMYEERYKKWRKKKTNEMFEEKKKQIKNSPNHYETHSRKYVEKMVRDFINDNQIMAHYGKDKQGIFEVRFEVKDE